MRTLLDIERNLEQTMQQLNPKDNLDCFVLCLQVISVTLRKQQADYQLKNKPISQNKFAGYAH